MVIFFGVLLALWLGRSMRLRFVGHFVLLGITMFIMMLPWYMRNYRNFGHFDFVSSTAYNAFVYPAAASEAAMTGQEYTVVKQRLLSELRQAAPNPENPSSLENKDYLLDVTKHQVITYRKGFANTYFLGLNTFLFSGNYHYLFYKYGVIAPPQKIISFSMSLASDGVGTTLSKLSTMALQPYVFLALIGKLFWIVMVLGSIIGAYFYRKHPVGILFLISIAYFSFTILSVTIGVEARHRYMLNPLIFLFFTAMIGVLYDRYLGRHSRI
jgi:hypothetical protein